MILIVDGPMALVGMWKEGTEEYKLGVFMDELTLTVKPSKLATNQMATMSRH
jgi:hypothetical protein